MLQIVALVTTFNRKKLSLNSLEKLHALFDGFADLKVVLVDASSNDGTQESVKQLFPEVNVIQVPSSTYWAGGMRKGFEKISLMNLDYDLLLAFNDDIDLFESSFDRIREVMSGQNSNEILCGAFCDSRNEITYGGFIRASAFNPLNFKVSGLGYCGSIDTLNFNFVSIPKKCLDDIGFLSDYFVHNQGDLEFGLRARSKGYQILVPDFYLGHCERNPNRLWSGLISEYRFVFSEKGMPLKQRFKYYRSWGGKYWPFFFVKPYVKPVVTFFRRVFSRGRDE